MSKSKDLFDDTTMSFGEHLEVLRIHLWKAIIGLVVCVIVTLFFGRHVIDVIRAPIDAALERQGVSGRFVIDDLAGYTGKPKTPTPEEPPPPIEGYDPEDPEAMPVAIKVSDLRRLLHAYDPERFPLAAGNRGNPDNPDNPDNPREAGEAGEAGEAAEAAEADEADEHVVVFTLRSPAFDMLHQTVKQLEEPITLTVEEAFMTYLKVSLVAGFVLGAPWIFYQIWLFVAAGLYPHERKYVHLFLPLTLGLFLGGAVFCFFVVFPYVLDFLLGFNAWLGVTPQIRLSQWISFAIMLPVMFGLSFQLPLVMLFLERISVFDVEAYQSKRRLAWFVIAIIAMLLTPADPMSMMLMMGPLVLLYEAGIQMCRFAAQRQGSPFPSETV